MLVVWIDPCAQSQRCLGRKTVCLSGKGRKGVTFSGLGRKSIAKETSFDARRIVKRKPGVEFHRSSRFAPVGSQGGEGREERAEVTGWVRRLFEGRGLALQDRKLHWLGVHLERFLRWCRQQGPPAELNALADGYLRWQAQLHPPPAEWQQAQIRQALEAFRQGVENWHWERQGAGDFVPRFRLRATPTAGTTPADREAGPPTRADAVAQSGESGGALADWRERMQRQLRFQHYASA